MKPGSARRWGRVWWGGRALSPCPHRPRRVLPRGAMAPAGAAFAAAIVFANLSFGIWQNWWIAALGLTAVFCRVMFDDPPPEQAP